MSILGTIGLSAFLLMQSPAQSHALLGSGAETDEAEVHAREALGAFIDAWNTGDNESLRTTMNFPFVSLFGSRQTVAQNPEDFATDFEGMRSRSDWRRSSFDFDTLEILESSPRKVHCAIDFHRFNGAGEKYMSGRSMYIVTEEDGHWGLKLRTGIGSADLSPEESELAVAGAREAVRRFFLGFNAGDTDAVTVPLNYPHMFLTSEGRVGVAKDRTGSSVRPDFAAMRASQGWHMSTIDSIEAGYVSPDAVHMNVVFSRWHQDGTRYLTVRALWIVTRHVEGDSAHWGIQLRSLMPPTFRAVEP